MDFRLDDFYYAILGLLDEEAPISDEAFDNDWADKTLDWWKSYVGVFTAYICSLSIATYLDFKELTKEDRKLLVLKSQMIWTTSGSLWIGRRNSAHLT